MDVVMFTKRGLVHASSFHLYLVVLLLLYVPEAEMTTRVQRDRTTVIMLVLERNAHYFNSSERTRLGVRGMRKDEEMS